MVSKISASLNQKTNQLRGLSVQLGDARIDVCAEGERSSVLVGSVIGSAATVWPGRSIDSADLRVCDSGDGFVVHVIDRPGFSAPSSYVSAGETADAVVGHICALLAQRSMEGLVFHAASVFSSAGTLLLPGASGAGKSTLAMHLARKGLGYLTDETSWVRGLEVEGVGRAVHLKETWAMEEPATISHETGGFVAPSVFAKDTSRDAPPLVAIVFPEYRPGEMCEVTTLSSAAGAFRLVSHLANGRNRPGHGIGEIASLARSVPCFQVTYSSCDVVLAFLISAELVSL